MNALAIAREWIEVEYEGVAGWISRQYAFRWGNCDVTVEAGAMMPPPAPTAVADRTEMTVPGARPLTHCNLRTGDIINLREGPGLAYSVIAEIPYRTNLSARGRAGEWFMVEYLSDAGWVHIDYVFRNGACA